MVNYTVGGQGQIDFLFSFSMYDLRGYTKWALDYSAGKSYAGKAMFTVDNVQTIIIMETETSGQGQFAVKFVKTTVNGLEMMLDNDDYCESVGYLAGERVPKVLERSLEMFVKYQSEKVLRNQIALIGGYKQQ